LRLSKECRRNNEEKRLRNEEENSLGREDTKAGRILESCFFRENLREFRSDLGVRKGIGG